MNTNNQNAEIDTIKAETAEDSQVVTVMDDGGKKTKKRVPTGSRNLIPPTLASGRDGRVPCSGGCTTLVLRSIGECRKCRRLRLKNGKRVIAKITKQQNNIVDAG